MIEPDLHLPHVLVLGGGFGGLYCVRALADSQVRVTLVDRHNHHLFQPLLYQVATAALDASDIASPLRQVFADQANVTVLLGDAQRVIPERRVVVIDGKEVGYDALVVATGVTHTYFGHDEYEAVAPGLKTLDDALAIRGRIFSAFERAERSDDPAERQKLTTFVIVGGGPTGVELAGALAEIATETLPGEFRRIDPTRTRILLVEAQPHLLGSYPEDLQRSAEAQLSHLGVELKLGALVQDVDEDSVTIAGERIATGTVLWAAGVRASSLGSTLDAPLDRSGRVLVAQDLSVPKHPEIFVVGDLAAVVSGGKPVPGVAQGAIQGGQLTAENVRRLFAGERTQPFQYFDKGSLATIGRARAVADLGFMKLTGPLAWLVWAGIHVLFLIGFRNRVSVMLSWSWAWLTRNRQARLVLDRDLVRHALPTKRALAKTEGVKTTA